MTERDPHIHVERQVVHSGAAVRGLLASTFGLVADSPSTVTAGCGLSVPYAMTSPRPESVTCLACREHAHREHLSFADQLESMGRMPGSPVASDQAVRAAAAHRALAARFAGQTL